MSKNICPTQSIEELKFNLSKIKEPVIVLPLNLPTQLYCIKNNISFYDPIEFIKNDFYTDVLKESENLIGKLDTGDLRDESHKKEYYAVIRFRFFSIAFLIELIEKISAKEKIEKIYLSGWNKYTAQYSEYDYFLSDIIVNIFKNKKIIKLSSEKFSTTKNIQKFTSTKIDFKSNKKYVILNNTGYNFKKIIFSLIKKNYSVIIPTFQNVSFIKKLLRFINIIFLVSKVDDNETYNFHLPDIKFSYKNKWDLSDLLTKRKNQEILNFKILKIKSSIIDDIFKKSKPKLCITFSTRGIQGYLIDCAKKMGIKSLCIPHGTLSGYFCDSDRIYRKIIAEPITSNNADFFATQSKITEDFCNKFKSNSRSIQTGNIVFAQKESKKKNTILFAVTLKDFRNCQFHGVETYYEFVNNLNFLDDLSKKNKLNIVVKIHPRENRCLNDLKVIFKNLKFSEGSLENLLEESIATISFSSTVIEDSLNSKVPVILFDQWHRYKHCEAQEDVHSKNSAVYYVNKKSSLAKCIDTIKNSGNIDFKQYIFDTKRENNIEKTINKLL